VKTASENVVRAVARIMAMARAGNIEAVAIVAVGPNGIPDTSFGGEEELLPSTYIGLDMLRQQMLHRVMAPVDLQISKIVRPAS
jgi:hypothetical protein